MHILIGRGWLAAAVLSTLLMSGRAMAAPLYQVSYLGYSFSNGLAAGINNSDQIIGMGVPGSIPGLPSGSVPNGINDAGQVVGTWANHGFLYHNGSLTDLGTLPGLPNSGANDINAAGDVVGRCTSGSGGTPEAFVYHNGVLTDLGPGAATGINASGTIIGTLQSYRAVVYQNGGVTDLGNFGDSLLTQAMDINDAGQIVGTGLVKLANNSYVNHPFLYEAGVWQDLGLPAGVPLGIPSAINNVGQVVGNSNGSLGAYDRPPFLYTDGTIYNLESLLDSSGTGLYLELAYDINDHGVILAEGWSGTGSYTGYQAVMLTPVPEPGTLMLVGIGAVWCVARRGRRGRSGR